MKNVNKKAFTPTPKPLVWGFTFIELLIAMTIFAVIASTIYCALNAGIRIWSREDSAVRTSTRTRVFLDAVSKDVRNAVSYAPIAPEWGRERISFTSLIDISTGEKTTIELAKVVWYLDAATSDVTRVRAAAMEGFAERYAQKEAFLQGVSEIAFAYCYAINSPDAEGEWKDAWEVEGKLPRAVKVRVKFKEKTGEGEPEVFEKIIFIPTGAFD